MRTSLLAAIAILAAVTCAGRAQSPATAPAPAPASQPAVESKPVEKDGLSVAVILPKATFAADEPVRFVLQYKNVSDKALWLYDAEWFWDWQIQFQDMKTGEPWRLQPLFKATRDASAKELKPGQTLEVGVAPAGKNRSVPFEFTWEGKQAEVVPPIKQLAPGKYRLTVQIALRQDPQSNEWRPYWQGQIATEPVELEIAPAPASAPALAPSSRPADAPAAGVLTPATRQDIANAPMFASDPSIQKAVGDYLANPGRPNVGRRWTLAAARAAGDYVLLWIAFPEIADGGVDLIYSVKAKRIEGEFKGGQRG